MSDFLQRRADWLAKLTKPQVKALFDYRRTARVALPDAENAMDAAWDDMPAADDASALATRALVQKMPREFVVSLDRGP